jgi:phospholipase/carboxylesterase
LHQRSGFFSTVARRIGEPQETLLRVADFLPCVEIEPSGRARSAVIWLHGLGANGHDFEPIVPELRLPEAAAIRFVFPHAPAIAVTINGGMHMPAWYDIFELSINRRVDEVQLRKSAQAVCALIDRELERGIDSRRIVVAGFSQGGAVAYEAALCYPKPLAGLLGLSSYFATAESIVPAPANQELPIQIYHGTQDPVVPEDLGHRSYQTFLAMGHPAHYKTYPIGHNVCLEEIEDISSWLQAVLAP